MRYLAVVFALLMVLPFTVSADEVFDEEFDSPSGWWGSPNPPDGWTISDDGDQSEEDWHQLSAGPSAPCAFINYYPGEFPMSDYLFKDDIDCSSYYNLELSYWVDINWYGGYYSGYFYVGGSTPTFWTTLLWVSWPSSAYGTMNHDISSWADYQPTVGVWFGIWINDSWGTDGIFVDSVHIEGDHDTAIQPTSLGKIKAMY